MEAAALTDDAVLYLYGFVLPSIDLSGLTGVLDKRPDVFLIQMGGVACAASLVPAGEYKGPPASDGAAEQLEWVAPRAWHHHEVLQHVHTAGTVVPFKFGTLCPSVQDVHTMLRRLRGRILDLLAYFRGKDEWTLNVCADNEALAALHATEPELLALELEAAGLPDGRRYFARKKCERAAAAFVEKTVDMLKTKVLSELSTLQIEILEARKAVMAPRATARHIVTAALLVDRALFGELKMRLADLEAEYVECGLTLELVGPWPPYSFATTLDVPDGPLN
jgi:hypothetical protein